MKKSFSVLFLCGFQFLISPEATALLINNQSSYDISIANNLNEDCRDAITFITAGTQLEYAASEAHNLVITLTLENGAQQGVSIPSPTQKCGELLIANTEDGKQIVFTLVGTLKPVSWPSRLFAGLCGRDGNYRGLGDETENSQRYVVNVSFAGK